jgi:hypothetical protein
MLPVPDRGLGNADDVGDFSLEETEVHPPFADVVTDGDGIDGIAENWSFFKGNMN